MTNIDKGGDSLQKPLRWERERRSIARSSIFQALWRLDKISINAPADTYCEYLDSEIEINSSDRECNACYGGVFEYPPWTKSIWVSTTKQNRYLGVTLYPAVESNGKKRGGLKRKRINSPRVIKAPRRIISMRENKYSKGMRACNIHIHRILLPL